MKATLRIPTKEQFAFIELEMEVDSPDAAVEAYHTTTGLFQPKSGLPDKDFNSFLDTYLESNTGDVNVYNKMSKEQQDVIQTIKRSVKRIEYKTRDVT